MFAWVTYSSIDIIIILNTVLQFLEEETPEGKFLMFLSMKLSMLLLLSRPCRASDLANLLISSQRITPEGASFMTYHLAKQSRTDRPLKEFFFFSLQPSSLLYPVSTLREYIAPTQLFRNN